MPALRMSRGWLVLLVMASMAASATDSNVAVVQTSSSAWLNGALIPRVSAIFPGDIVQTKTDPADIDAFGSKILVLQDSVLTYQSNGVELDRGTVSVGTSKAFATQIANLTVRPAAASWSEFQVSDHDNAVHIVALKGDLVLVDESGTTTLNAGQETTREVHAKKKKRAAGAPPQGVGSVMDSKAALFVGAVAIGVPIGWVLFQGDDPISPDKP